ncbi:MAG: FAD-dependent oxidoreductase [Deltaproteobacteria bacterium]|nr:FAD-dependent oxidoreductase [Deltaproteobacteria bacterium]
MARTPEKFEETGIHVRLHTMVEGIDTKKGEVCLKDGEKLPYDTLVIGTGALAVMPTVSGIDEEGVFVLRNLRDALDIKAYIRERGCKKAIIVGAGFIAMEMSEALSTIGMETQIVYRGKLPAGRWDGEFGTIVLDELKKHRVSFMPERQLQVIESGNKGRLRLFTNDGTFDGDIIILALGIKPDTRLAEQAGCALGDTGAIGVDHYQKTSQEVIYAVGDCCEAYHRIARKWVHVPLGDVANKQGRIAGRNIGGLTARFDGIVGAQSFKVFDLELGATGLDEGDARRAGFNPGSVIVWGSPVAGSLNMNKEKLGMKIIADKHTGKLLGAQAIGNSGAVGRINVLSACLWAGMDLDNVAFMDLAYAPPFGGAWDLIHVGAQVLQKKL